MEKELITQDSCDCSDKGCCEPRRGGRWKRIALLAVIVAACSIILYKLLSPAPAPSCGAEGCCPDSAGCVEKKQ